MYPLPANASPTSLTGPLQVNDAILRKARRIETRTLRMDREVQASRITTIDAPQIYVLEQRDPAECSYVLLHNALNDGETNSRAKMAMSYHKLSMSKNVILFIYDGEVEDGKPLRAFVSHKDWSFDGSSTSSNLPIFNP